VKGGERKRHLRAREFPSHFRVSSASKNVGEGMFRTGAANNDIALIQLQPDESGKCFKFDLQTGPICLPRAVDSLKVRDSCYITGWGRTSSQPGARFRYDNINSPARHFNFQRDDTARPSSTDKVQRLPRSILEFIGAGDVSYPASHAYAKVRNSYRLFNFQFFQAAFMCG
jgi:hypothetical protein